MKPLFSIPVLAALVLALVPACNLPKKPKPEAPGQTKPKPAPARKPLIPDASTDVSFQAFLGRLRIAVKQRDRGALTQMMAPDFGFKWEAATPGESPFDFWEQHNSWGELEKLLLERFAPSEGYMVSPPAFVADPNYRGYRCGVRQVNGSWRFAYFVTGEDLLQ